jgi:hypothetical protein
MTKLSKEDKIELSRILESIQGRIDNDLSKLMMDLIFKTRIKIQNEDLVVFLVKHFKFL